MANLFAWLRSQQLEELVVDCSAADDDDGDDDDDDGDGDGDGDDGDDDDDDDDDKCPNCQT